MVVGAAFVIGYLPRHKAKKELVTETKVAEGGNLKVQVFTPRAKSSDRALTLPASVQPLEDAVDLLGRQADALVTDRQHAVGRLLLDTNHHDRVVR